MSGQAGVWQFDGSPADRTLLESFSRRLAQHGPDSENILLSSSLGMIYRALHRSSYSRCERQPHVSLCGNVITWDGWLDNHDDLAAQLTDGCSTLITPVDVVGAAFDRWGLDCFARFIGDWAFAGWSPNEATLTLAIDYMAIKRLYYSLQPRCIMWCTDLEALVLQSDGPHDLDDEYVAGYLAHNHAIGHTPYRKIKSVKPGHFVQIRYGHAESRSYFAFNSQSMVRYRTDAEYEEHFRHVFRQAVRRRLRSDAPILADLSGGLDSSSIVCMADDILEKEGAETPRIDTYSHYDISEPDGDDIRYFSIVERKRGRVGHRQDIGQYPNSLLPDYSSFVVAPGGIGNAPELRREHCRIWESGGYKTSLSGVGGDEMLGGVPDPRPELADLLLQFRLFEFISRTAEWSLVKKMPWIHLGMRAAALLAPSAVRACLSRESELAPWIDSRFAASWKLSIRQLGPLARYGFWLPSRQECARTVVALAATQASNMACTSGIGEKRYPYLDQNLVEFLLSIPRDQLIRPGQRRSLMRRALAGLVPDEILSRRTKGTVSRRPLVAMADSWQELDSLLDRSLVAQCGYVNQQKFRNALLAAKSGDAPQLLRLLRTLSLELWLRATALRGFIRLPARSGPGCADARDGALVRQSAQLGKM